MSFATPTESPLHEMIESPLHVLGTAVAPAPPLDFGNADPVERLVPYSFNLFSGGIFSNFRSPVGLPAGLTLSSGGLISGTATSFFDPTTWSPLDSTPEFNPIITVTFKVDEIGFPPGQNAVVKFSYLPTVLFNASSESSSITNLQVQYGIVGGFTPPEPILHRSFYFSNFVAGLPDSYLLYATAPGVWKFFLQDVANSGGLISFIGPLSLGTYSVGDGSLTIS